MQIRKLNATDREEVLAMMEIFYASDALLIHPEERVLRQTLTDSSPTTSIRKTVRRPCS